MTSSRSYPRRPFPFPESIRALSAGERQKLNSSGGRKNKEYRVDVAVNGVKKVAYKKIEGEVNRILL